MTTKELEDGQVEFAFPDEVENRKAAAKDEVEEKQEIEVIDDTPEVDRNRTVSTPPADPTEEELKSYSEKVQARVRGLTKGYHDERRAKEAAQREKDESIRVAQAVVEENRKLKGSLSKGQNALLETTRKNIEAEVIEARREYKEAYESFDADKVTDAQEKLTAAKIKQSQIENFRPAPLQDDKKEVQTQQQNRTQPPEDPKARAWQDKNPWFGKDREVTSYTLGLHEKLVVEEGLDPRSDEYYSRIDNRLRKLFPEIVGGAARDEASRSSVVAPASRSTAPKKIVLTQTQVALAKKLGLSLETYARQVVIEQRESK